MSLSDPPLQLSFGGVLKYALIAGLTAALVVSAVHFVITEPLIEQAVALEALSEPTMEPPVVSREAQRVGLFVGFLLYGLTWALFYSVAFQLSRRRFAGASLRSHSLALAGAAFWGVSALPFFRYPANPPGVGEPESITYRQGLYVAALVLSVVGTILAAVVGKYVAGRTPIRWAPWLAAVGFLAIYSAALYLAMPANPDPIKIPLWLVDDFRLRSIVGLGLFWLVMGSAFAFLAQRAAAPRAIPVRRTT